jgi:guanylate kinase
MLLIRLSGHSGAGKSRLLTEISKRKVKYRKAVLYTSRPARDGEIHGKDYYFLSRGAIEQLPADTFFKGQVREMLQAVDLKQLEYDLRSGDTVIIEIFHALWPGLERTMKQRLQNELSTASLFLTAVDPDRLRKTSNNAAADLIKREVKGFLEWRKKDPVDAILKRAASAVDEVLGALKSHSEYDNILYSAPEGPDGEDDWTKYDSPVGQAAHTVDQFLSFIEEKSNRS